MNLNEKPSDNCGGCKDYKEKCHCLCHSSIESVGYHEIIFDGGNIHKSNFLERIYNKIVKNNKI